jgi:hypothetical protein
MAKYFGLFTLIFLIGCNVTDTNLDYTEPIDLVLDGRTDLDSNGFYHLTLDSTRNQTPHRVTGTILNQEYITKVDWESNLTWYFNGEVVPTINKASYSNESGEVNVMIAPIYKMKGDTLIITGKVTESTETETIRFVLQ